MIATTNDRFLTLGRDRVLFFPVSAFRPDGSADIDETVAHVRRRLAEPIDGVFVACGTGEYFALADSEYTELVRAVVGEVAGRVPVIAGAGRGGQQARQSVRHAADAGADAVLLFPPDGPRGGSRGVRTHMLGVADAAECPVILYQRDGVLFTPEDVEAFLEHSSIVGIKDGMGDIEQLQWLSIMARGRLGLFNGLPTAEASSLGYAGLGIDAYSSAVFAFFPEAAVAFKSALVAGDAPLVERLLTEVFHPIAALRSRGAGYAVSLVKAGLELRGEPAGPPRAPLTPVAPEHRAALGAIMDAGWAVLRGGEQP